MKMMFECNGHSGLLCPLRKAKSPRFNVICGYLKTHFRIADGLGLG